MTSARECCDPEISPRSRDLDAKPIVTVIGGGIAGLTVAHELIERGFRVYLVEKTPSQDKYADCQVGGMAANVYARAQEELGRLYPGSQQVYFTQEPRLPIITIIEEWRKYKMVRVVNRVPIPESIRVPCVDGRVDSAMVMDSPALKWLARKLKAANREYRNHFFREVMKQAKDEGAKKLLEKLNFFQSVKAKAHELSLAATNLFDEFQSLTADSGDVPIMVEAAENALKEQKEVSGTFLRVFDSDEDIGISLILNHVKKICEKLAAYEENKGENLKKPEKRVRELLKGMERYGEFFRREFAAFLDKDKLALLLKKFEKVESLRIQMQIAEKEALAVRISIAAPEAVGPEIHADLVARIRELSGLGPLQVETEKLRDCCAYGSNPEECYFEVRVKVLERRVPGEHGFRFFPSFYRHLFDVMKRTPVLDEKNRPTHETAYDQLVGVDTMEVARNDCHPLFEIKRHPPRSLGDWRDTYRRFSQQLGISPHDMYKILVRLVKFATSSSLRREREFEEIPWMQFLGGPSNLSYAGARLISHLPRALAGMMPSDVDTRTHGNVQFQLLLDFFTNSEHKDMTLNGPTSEAWLEPWKKYLEWQGVRFISGEMLGFQAGGGELKPVYGSSDTLDFGSLDPESILKSMFEPAFTSFAEASEGAATDSAGSGEPMPELDVLRILSDLLNGIDLCDPRRKSKLADALRDLRSLNFRRTVAAGGAGIPISDFIDGLVENMALGGRFTPADLEIGQIELIGAGTASNLIKLWGKADSGFDLDKKMTVKSAVAQTMVAAFYLVFRSKVLAALKLTNANLRVTDPDDFNAYPFSLLDIVRRLRPYLETSNLLPTTEGLLETWEIVKQDLNYRHNQKVFAESMGVNTDIPRYREWSAGNSDWVNKEFLQPDFHVLALSVHEASRLVCEFVDTESINPLEVINRRMAAEDEREYEDRYPRFLQEPRRYKNFENISEDYRGRRRIALNRIVDGDLLQLYHWAKEADLAGPTPPELRDESGMPKEPLRHPYRDISGIQFFFKTRVRIGTGHVYYPDSPWALTSISQPDRWRNRIDPARPFLGQTSLDVGDFYTRGRQSLYKAAWNCTPEEFYMETFSQMLSSLDQKFQAAFLFRRTGMNVPDFITLDPSLEFKASNGGGIIRNHMPFLINLPGKWRLRPGLIALQDDSKPTLRDVKYTVSNQRWVLAGTYMATHTRMTTMEAACESGRHAVNAILEHLQGADPVNPLYNSAGMFGGQPCEIWPLEEREPKDLDTFKQVDQELARKGLPHFLDILGVVDWVDRNGVIFKSFSDMGENLIQYLQSASQEGLAKMAMEGPGAAGKNPLEAMANLAKTFPGAGQIEDLFKKLYGEVPKLHSGLPFAADFGKTLEKMLKTAIDSLHSTAK